jgi:uncharacterized protein YdeI (YjbR/CyaY-like superfamily)
MKEFEQVLIEKSADLRQWLQQNHQNKKSVWLVKWKKESGMPSISYDEIVDELMCFGWVDSLPRKLNAQKTMLMISPRNPKSNWSRVNKERVERLEAEGRMQPSGQEVVTYAKKNGQWNFLDDVEALIIPTDLKEALRKNKKAEHYFNRFPDSSKRGILEWIKNAKQSDTRQKRVDETVLKASQNLKANHPKGRDAGPQ